MTDPSKKPAIDAELASKRMGEITAAEFLQALEDAEPVGRNVSADATVGDVLGVSPRLPEKKKVELELPEKKKVELEKSQIEVPEKKKVELEKTQVEIPEKKKVELELPEKKKVELEKPRFEFPEKQKVELERPDPGDLGDPPPDMLAEVRRIGERLTRIEQQLGGQGAGEQQG
jgi:hypothetical protein